MSTALLPLVGLLAAGPALAGDVDLTAFRPASAGDGLYGVEGARPPIEGEPRFELRLAFDAAVHSLVFQPASGPSQVLVKSRTGGTLSASLHLFGPLSLAAQLPAILSQTGDLSPLPPSARAPLGAGFGDVRLTPRLALLRQEPSGVIDLSLQASLDLPTAKSSSFSGDGSTAGELLVAAAHRMQLPRAELELVANAFADLRPPRELYGVKTGDSLGLRGGLAFLPQGGRFLPRRVFGEVEGQAPFRGGIGSSSPAEWRAGATFCAAGALAIEAAGGGALGHGIGAPAARLGLAIGWVPSTCSSSAPAPAVIAAPAAVAAPEAIAAPAVIAAPTPIAAPSVEPTRAEPPPHAAEPIAQPKPEAPPPEQEVAAPLALEPPKPQASTIETPKIESPPELPPPSLEPPHLEPTPSPQAEVAPPLPELPAPPIAEPPLRGQRIRFASGGAELDAEALQTLAEAARAIAAHPETAVEIAGHADSQEDAQLAFERASAVAAALVAQGVPPERLRVKSYGADKPAAPNLNAASRAKNRRVELVPSP